MNFTAHFPDTGRRLGGLGVMLGVHALVAYALIAGLHPIAVPIAQVPVAVRLVEEALQAPTPQHRAAPPASQPSPAPVQARDAPTQEITPNAAIEPAHESPAPEMSTPAMSAPTTSAPSVTVLCPGYQDAIRMSPPPREVMQEGIGGEVLVEFTVTPNGTVRNPIPISSTNPRLNRWALHTVLTQIRCQPQAQAVQLRVPISVRFE